MGFFERWFRSRFTPAGDGYSFRHDDLDYRFDEDEVEDFVAEWRKHWANPLVWAGYLLFGVALPVWLYFVDFAGLTFVFGTIAGVAMLVNLIFPLRQPHEVAAGRVRLAEAPRWQPPNGVGVLGAFGFTAVLGAIAWFSHKPESHWFDWPDIFPMFLALHMLWTAVVEWVLWRRIKRGAGQFITEERMRDLRSDGACFVAFIATIIWLSPVSDWAERGFSVFLLICIAGADVWQRLKRKREAAEASAP